MFCKYCGTKINDGEVFCPNCGKEAAEIPAQAAPSAPVQPAPAAPVQPAPAAPVQPAPAAPVQPVQPAPAAPVQPAPAVNQQPIYKENPYTVQPKNDGDKKVAVLIIVLCAVIVLAIGGIIFALFASETISFGSKSNKTTSSKDVDDDDEDDKDSKKKSKDKDKNKDKDKDKDKKKKKDKDDPTPEPEPSEEPPTDENELYFSVNGVDADDVSASDVTPMLSKLSSDYSRISWDVECAISNECPGIVTSFSSYEEFGASSLICGLTNLYDADVCIYASGYARGADDELLGDVYIYAQALGKDSTAVTLNYLNEAGKVEYIEWTTIDVMNAYNETADYDYQWDLVGSPSDGFLDLEVHITNTDDTIITPNEMYGILLDDEGKIIRGGVGYIYDPLDTGDTVDNKIQFYADEEVLSQASNAALFVNATK